jgi:hypothetical protein
LLESWRGEEGFGWTPPVWRWKIEWFLWFHKAQMWEAKNHVSFDTEFVLCCSCFVKSSSGLTFFCLVFTFCTCLETQCYVQTTTCLVHLSDDLLSATWTVNNNGREELSFSDGASEKGKHLHSSMYVSSVFVSDWWWMPCHITPFYSSLHFNFASSRSLDCSPSHHSSLESSKPKPLILYCILWTWTGDFLQSKFVPKVACFCSEEQWLGWGEDGPGLRQILLLSMFQDVRCKWAAKQNCGLQFKWAWGSCISKHQLSVFSLVCLFLHYVITLTSPPLCHCFSMHSTSQLTMNFRLMWWSPHRCQQYHWHFCLTLIASWWGLTCILCKESLAIK